MSAPLITLAQTDDAAPGASVWSLFVESFDIFSVVLLIGSLAGVTIIARLLLEARRSVISPRSTPERIDEALDRGDTRGALEIAHEQGGIVGDALVAAHAAGASGARAMREAAELAASAACVRWTRPLDLLRMIGELGPLVGLAGTVWGMILAFVRLGQAGGAAGPTDLSLGISKALFHTLLGLMLAVPCLLVYGWYRSAIEKWCNEAFARAGELVDRLARLHDTADFGNAGDTGDARDTGEGRAGGEGA